jgi:hypothetical protein
MVLKVCGGRVCRAAGMAMLAVLLIAGNVSAKTWTVDDSGGARAGSVNGHACECSPGTCKIIRRITG